MSTNHGDGVTGLPFLADGKSDDRGGISCEIILASRLEGGRPVVPFFNLREALFGKSLNGRVDCMVG